MYLGLRFSERNRAGIHLTSLELGIFEPVESSAVGNPRVMGIQTLFHPSIIALMF